MEKIGTVPIIDIETKNPCQISKRNLEIENLHHDIAGLHHQIAALHRGVINGQKRRRIGNIGKIKGIRVRF